MIVKMTRVPGDSCVSFNVMNTGETKWLGNCKDLYHGDKSRIITHYNLNAQLYISNIGKPTEIFDSKSSKCYLQQIQDDDAIDIGNITTKTKVTSKGLARLFKSGYKYHVIEFKSQVYSGYETTMDNGSLVFTVCYEPESVRFAIEHNIDSETNSNYYILYIEDNSDLPLAMICTRYLDCLISNKQASKSNKILSSEISRMYVTGFIQKVLDKDKAE